MKGETEKVRYDKLKRLAYDIDDVLDKYKTAVLKSEVERDEAQTPSTSSVSSQVPNTPISLFGGIAPRIKELNKRVEAIAKEKDYLSLAIDKSSSTDPKLERLETTSFFVEPVVYGRDHDKLDLIDRLLVSDNNRGRRSGNDTPLIAIVGMGGLGKTTLAGLVFKDKRVRKHFHKRIWVCVSDPFDEVRIAKAILESLKGEPSKFNVLHNLLEEIEEIIEEKRFLLVLDDVWTEDENKWKQLKGSLCSASRESRILVTTRKKNVATMMCCSNPILLDLLSKEDSWSLFSEAAFWGRSEEDCENLESIGREIVDKCGGLPLAIKTMANLLCSKGTEEQWQRISDSEMWELEDPEIFKDLYAPLLLSYCDLPMSVQQCFRYCAIFPKDYEIRRDELIKLWMAQGFLGETRKVNELEMMGEDCFDKLAMRGLFQEFKKDEIGGSIIECKMHDVVHDFGHFLTKTECLLVEGQRLAESFHENARHLTLIAKPDNIPIDGIKGLEKLRSFLVQYNSDAKVPKLYESMSNLIDQLISVRVLRFYSGHSVYDNYLRIPKEIGNLIHIRYLNLEGNSLRELSETLCDLCNLQTLNIRKCHTLRELPRGMGRLTKLRHLQNGSIKILMPKGVGRLTSLQTLEEIAVIRGGNRTSSDSFSLADLGKLIHLRGKLSIQWLGNVEETSEAREAQLSTKTGLRSLTLDFRGGNFKKREKKTESDALLLQALHPPPRLHTLKIEFCGWEEWEYELLLRSRGGQGHQSSSSSSSSSIAFPSIMPKLQRLSIGACSKLKTLPHHLLQSRALQELTIRESRFLFERFNKERGHDWPSISHIPQVEIKRPFNFPRYSAAEILEQEPSSSSWSGQGVWKELLLKPSKPIQRILIAAIGVNFFMQASGNDAVVYYSPKVFKDAGISDRKQQIGVSIIMGIAKTCFVFISALFLDRFGSRPLLLIGSIGMVISLGGLGFGSKYLEQCQDKPEWAIALCIVAGIVAVGTVFFYFFLPETKGKSLEEIEVLFEDKPLDGKQ
ncbi:Disease resistance protein [Corchorus capsularis]|uniref:Disease resistance protein n=1 Tax=Corchorus capsularis TaxID=210143 RepID=A0A1R3JI49_COCAP|nr:Disease resistance protein [Corchorus capsularis]